MALNAMKGEVPAQEAPNTDIIESGMEKQINPELIQEYFDAKQQENDGKKAAEKLRPRVVAALNIIGRIKTNVGAYVVQLQEKNNTVVKDKAGLFTFLKSNPATAHCVVEELDKKALEEVMAQGIITAEQVTEFFGLEPATPALQVKLAKGAK